MLDRGKLAVLTMFALALAAATFAWSWNVSRGKRALEFYGPEAAHLIRTAPQVEILLVAARTPEPEEELVDGLAVNRKIDISKAPGLIHARTALLDDASYDWNAKPLSQSFRFGIRFANGQNEVVLLVGLPRGTIIVAGSEKGSGQLIQKTAEGWIGFMERNIKLAESDGKQER